MMQHDAHAPNSPPHVSAQTIAVHTDAWHGFMRFVVANCVAVAGLLLFLLLIFKIF